MTFDQIVAEIHAESKKVRSPAWIASGAGALPRVFNQPTVALVGSMELIREQYENHRKAIDAQEAFLKSPAFETLTKAEQLELFERIITDMMMATFT